MMREMRRGREDVGRRSGVSRGDDEEKGRTHCEGRSSMSEKRLPGVCAMRTCATSFDVESTTPT